MKLKNITAVVETNNVTEGNTFKIKSSRKTFAILSSGLYSNKIEAVVRELTCNAYDSHTERNINIRQGTATKYTAPEEKNMRVQFPSAFDLFFSVRDFGIGLTPEDVEGVFTVYFESTKQDSNDLIGALGLGCKSPFAYATSFNVIATKNGHRVVYTMFLNANGVPQPAKLDEGPVESFYDEDEVIPEEEFYDGVEVKVPTEPNDLHSFLSAAENIFKYFEVPPELVHIGTRNVKYYKDKDENEKLLDGVYIANRGHNSKQLALQGNVAYPIELSHSDFKRAVHDIDKFDNIEDNTARYTEQEVHELWEFYQSVFTDYQMYIEFNIGDLDVAASREELSYDAGTIMAILGQIVRVKDGITNKFCDHMDTFDTKWDQARELMRISKGCHYSPTDSLYRNAQCHTLYLATENIPQLITDGSFGTQLAWTIEYSTLSVPEEKNKDFEMKMCGMATHRRFFILTNNIVNPQQVSGYVGHNKVPALAENLQIIVNDTKQGGATLAKEYMRAHSRHSRCLLLDPYKRGQADGIAEYLETQNLKMDTPGFDIAYISDIKQAHPDIGKRDDRSPANTGYYTLIESYRRVGRINTTIPDVYETDKVVYIPFKQQLPNSASLNLTPLTLLTKAKDTPLNMLDMTQLLIMTHGLDGVHPPVIGLNQNMLRQVKDYDNWISISDYLVEKYHELFGADTERKRIESSIKFKRKTNDIHKNSEISLNDRKIPSLYARIKDFPELADISSILKIKSNPEKSLSALEKIYEIFYSVESYPSNTADIINKYAMLTMIEDSYSWTDFEESELDKIVAYCLLCNQGENK
jgi:hypothetical protein